MWGALSGLPTHAHPHILCLFVAATVKETLLTASAALAKAAARVDPEDVVMTDCRGASTLSVPVGKKQSIFLMQSVRSTTPYGDATKEQKKRIKTRFNHGHAALLDHMGRTFGLPDDALYDWMTQMHKQHMKTSPIHLDQKQKAIARYLFICDTRKISNELVRALAKVGGSLAHGVRPFNITTARQDMNAEIHADPGFKIRPSLADLTLAKDNGDCVAFDIIPLLRWWYRKNGCPPGWRDVALIGDARKVGSNKQTTILALKPIYWDGSHQGVEDLTPFAILCGGDNYENIARHGGGPNGFLTQLATCSVRGYQCRLGPLNLLHLP